MSERSYHGATSHSPDDEMPDSPDDDRLCIDECYAVEHDAWWDIAKISDDDHDIIEAIPAGIFIHRESKLMQNDS